MILARNTGICLNMIVKNETPVLNRLFLSLKNVIDYYVIVDTGSTDGTPDLIRERMADYGIPGEVHHREWVNFSVNRNQALQLAYAAGKSRWALIIDADEELGCSDSAFVKRLQPGGYLRTGKTPWKDTLRASQPDRPDPDALASTSRGWRS